MKFPVVEEFSSYTLKLSVAQLDKLFGVGVDFRKVQNESMFLALNKLDGVIDAWYDFVQFEAGNYGITIRVKSDKDNVKLWNNIHSTVDRYLKR